MKNHDICVDKNFINNYFGLKWLRHISLDIYNLFLYLVKLLKISRIFKTLIALVIDTSLVYIAIVIGFYLRLGSLEFVPKI